MKFVLFDDNFRVRLLPFTHTRPVAEIRCGIVTIREKWEHFLNGEATHLTVPYLMPAFNPDRSFTNLYVNGAIFPDPSLTNTIQELQLGEILVSGDRVIAIHSDSIDTSTSIDISIATQYKMIEFKESFYHLDRPWDIFTYNDQQIQMDYAWLTEGRTSQALPDYVTAIGAEHIFVEEGATILPCILNATNAHIYIGKDSEIMEGSMMRGNIAICEHAVVKMGAKIYSGTTIGTGCKVGGEIQNAIFFANSNKGHDGYLGNAVIGEWCNLGADTNCSNLKNDYGMVDAYAEDEGKYIETGLQFCGLLMGDHSKCSINTMFNTGTVVGISCNLFGTDFPPKYVPSFSWGGAQQLKVYKLEKAKRTANSMMERRKKMLTPADDEIFQFVFDQSPIHSYKNKSLS